MDHTTRDKLIGSFIGLAIGDTLGMPLEFSRRDSKPAVIEPRAGGPFDLPLGCYTDDTIMAVHLAESLVDYGELIGADVITRWRCWMRKGAGSPTGTCFDIGSGTRAALSANANTRPVIIRNNAGNGSLMRYAPMFIHSYMTNPNMVAIDARAQSDLTHNGLAGQGCAELGLAMLSAMRGIKCNTPDDIAGMRDIRKLKRAGVKSSGYCVHTLEAALWAVWHTTSFADAVLLAVNLGDDSDTVGAVTGQLAGALYGYSSIPHEWVDVLYNRDHLLSLAEQLLDAERLVTPPNDEA